MTEVNTAEDVLSGEDLNKAIRELETQFENDMPHSKPIPYMGWFWRTVNFDADRCSFGLCPNGTGKPPFVAFMENNKWGYSSITIDGNNWNAIKAVLQVAARERTLASVRAAYDAIQALGANLRSTGDCEDENGFDATLWEKVDV